MSLTVDDRQFTSIVGPSGLGQTALPKAVVGRLPYSGGSVQLHEVVDGAPGTNVEEVSP